MIKNIIFDLDNTLIMFNEKYLISHQNALKKCGYDYTEKEVDMLQSAIMQYEKASKTCNKKTLLDFINNYLNRDYQLKLIDTLLQEVSDIWVSPIGQDIVDVLNYLSKKYNLYVLTNWFTDTQLERLKKVNLDNYFKKIVGADLTFAKPHKEAFSYIVSNNNPKEYLMIGDNPIIDIKGAIDAGLNALLYDYKNQYSNLEYKRFTDFKQLKKIL